MSFTDGKLFTIEPIHVEAKFSCGICGHKLRVGDKARWIYMRKGESMRGHIEVCQICDDLNDESDIKELVECMDNQYRNLTNLGYGRRSR